MTNGGVDQWLERWSLTDELSLACAMTCSWRVTSAGVNRSLYVIQRWPTQPFIFLGSIHKYELNLGVRCYAYMRGGATWGMLTELKADMVLFAGNTVWSISERPEARFLLLTTTTCDSGCGGVINHHYRNHQQQQHCCIISMRSPLTASYITVTLGLICLARADPIATEQ